VLVYSGIACAQAISLYPAQTPGLLFLLEACPPVDTVIQENGGENIENSVMEVFCIGLTKLQRRNFQQIHDQPTTACGLVAFVPVIRHDANPCVIQKVLVVDLRDLHGPLISVISRQHCGLTRSFSRE